MQVHLLSRVSIAREILAYFGTKAEVNDGLRDAMHNHKRVLCPGVMAFVAGQL